MLIRRAATALSTLVVAVVVALSVPIAQLHTVAIIHECCCPDPDNCHCPDEHGDPNAVHPASMRTCHRSTHAIVAPVLPSFAPAPVELAVASPRVIASPALPLPVPHAAPAPQRPEAPS